MLKERSKLKHRRHKANKKSKGKYYEEIKWNFDEDDPQYIFDQKFDIYALDYLCNEKIDQLLANIQLVCRRYQISY